MQFSQIDSFNPPEIDTLAESHLRTAIHFLPASLVKRKLTTPKPANWKTELKQRKQFIYYPFC